MSVSPNFTLHNLLNGFVESAVMSDLQLNDIKITGLAYDSRTVQAGDLFFACDGETVHGIKFISAAVKSGAIAIALEVEATSLAETAEVNALSEKYQLPIIPIQNLTTKLGFIASRFYGEPTSKLSLIGITGTNGKTSISHLLAQCLNEPAKPCGVIGTMGAGLWGQLRPVKNTTPGAVELQQWFYALVKKHTKFVAMEVSSHGLVQGRTNGCEFDVAVFTNLTQDHLDYHGSMASYGEAKLKLFNSNEHGKNLNAVVINLDDDFSRNIMDVVTDNVSIVGVTLNESSVNLFGDIDVIVGHVKETNNTGMKIHIKSSIGSGDVNTSLLGDFNASNLLTVFACTMALGFEFDDVCKKLEKMQAPMGRLEKFGGGKQPLVVVDYAHTPDALEKALSTLRKHTAGKLWVLMGCGGDRDKTKRPKMGAIAEAHADVVWLTNDNPRTESADKIIEDVLSGVYSPEKISVEIDRKKAITSVVELANSNDVVLIAGKGHEDYQIIGDQRMHFSDREIVAELLREAA